MPRTGRALPSRSRHDGRAATRDHRKAPIARRAGPRATLQALSRRALSKHRGDFSIHVRPVRNREGARHCADQRAARRWLRRGQSRHRASIPGQFDHFSCLRPADEFGEPCFGLRNRNAHGALSAWCDRNPSHVIRMRARRAVICSILPAATEALRPRTSTPVRPSPLAASCSHEGLAGAACDDARDAAPATHGDRSERNPLLRHGAGALILPSNFLTACVSIAER